MKFCGQPYRGWLSLPRPDTTIRLAPQAPHLRKPDNRLGLENAGCDWPGRFSSPTANAQCRWRYAANCSPPPKSRRRSWRKLAKRLGHVHTAEAPWWSLKDSPLNSLPERLSLIAPDPTGGKPNRRCAPARLLRVCLLGGKHRSARSDVHTMQPYLASLPGHSIQQQSVLLAKIPTGIPEICTIPIRAPAGSFKRRFPN